MQTLHVKKRKFRLKYDLNRTTEGDCKYSWPKKIMTKDREPWF